jgi:DNA-binding transcriptional LysR family regulator
VETQHRPGSQDRARPDYASHIELRHLRYFIAVAEEGNVSRAALRLGIAQPPLSQQIKKLENFLDVSLLRRTSRGVELTPGGESFLEQARSVLSRMEAAIQVVRDIEHGERGEFNLGSAYSGLFLLVPTIVQAFNNHFPRADIKLREMSTAEQIKALLDGRIDAGIMRMPVSDDRLQVKVLLEEPYVLAVPLDHRLAGQDVVSLAEIKDEFLIAPVFGRDLSFKQQAASILRKNGIVASGIYEAPEMNVLIGLVSAGLGVAIMPKSSSTTMKYTNIAFKPFLEPTPPFMLGVAWNPELKSPMRGAFVDLIVRMRDERPT